MSDSAASTDDVWTVQRILHWTTDFLQEKGVESARLEAELLLAHARNCQRIRLYTDFETPLTDNERSRMREFVKRRADREPLAYITGRREFYGRDFVVGAGVLVPRPETEILVDVCLEFLPEDTTARICEIGFGSGCIAVTLAKQRTGLQVVASDISLEAMEFASANVRQHGVGERITLLTGDGFEPIHSAACQLFDGVVSNPPYIRPEEMRELAPEVSQHEPEVALVSGHDGMQLIRRLINDAPRTLKPGGWIVLEMDPSQCDESGGLLQSLGFEDVQIQKDLNGDDRIVTARLKNSLDEIE